MNLFDVNTDPHKLYNIGTGIASNDFTDKFLLNIFENGKKAKKHLLKNIQKTTCILKNLSRENHYTLFLKKLQNKK